MECKKDLVANVCNLALYSKLKDLLLWKRCLFMTFDQYKKDEHVNKKMYCHYAITKNIKEHIVSHLKTLALNLPFKKVPKPIYVSIAKHLEYDSGSSILPASCKNAYNDLMNNKINYDELKKAHEDKLTKYNGYDISCFVNKDNKIIDRGSKEILNNIFVYDRLGSPESIEYLKKSSLAAYKISR